MPSSVLASDALYAADEDGGFSDWVLPEGWIYRNGHLLSDGTVQSSVILAPFALPVGLVDYAVEAEVRLIRCDYAGGDMPVNTGGLGLVARAEEAGAYWGGNSCQKDREHAAIWAVAELDDNSGFDRQAFVEQPLPVAGQWSTYRIEVEGFDIRLFIDDMPVVQTMDVRFAGPGQVGLWSSLAQIEVRSFAVVPLDMRSGRPVASTPGPATP